MTLTPVQELVAYLTPVCHRKMVSRLILSPLQRVNIPSLLNRARCQSPETLIISCWHLTNATLQL